MNFLGMLRAVIVKELRQTVRDKRMMALLVGALQLGRHDRGERRDLERLLEVRLRTEREALRFDLAAHFAGHHDRRQGRGRGTLLEPQEQVPAVAVG